MIAYVGQTRSRALIGRLAALGIGECTVRGELPPRRWPFFLDNGAFRDWTNGEPFNAEAFAASVAYVVGQGLAPDFVVAPDVVAGGLESLRESLAWVPRLAGLPIYLAVQDGMREADVAPHVGCFAGIFVGGTLEWKLDTGGGLGRLRPRARKAVSRGADRDAGSCGVGARDRGGLDRLVLPALER